MSNADDRPKFFNFLQIFKIQIFVAIFGFCMKNALNEYKQA